MSLPSDPHFLIFYFPLASVPTYCLFFFPSFRFSFFPYFRRSFSSSPPSLLTRYALPSFLRSRFLLPPFLLPPSFPLVLFFFFPPYLVASSRLLSCIHPSLERPSLSFIPASLPSYMPSFLLSVLPSLLTSLQNKIKEKIRKPGCHEASKPRSASAGFAKR